jgi:putative transposase
MDKELREQIALFRFGVIADLVNRTGLSRGEQEARLREIAEQHWQIPGSPRSRLTRSTVLRWIALYQRSGGRLESLQPQPRADRGKSRALDEELEAALVTLRKEMPAVSLPVFYKYARTRGILPPERTPSKDSLYRLFRRHGLDRDTRLPEDRRKFETEMVNDLWQSDCMHGPKVEVDGKLRKSYLFAVIDDHSRLIPCGRFYLSENLESYRDCLIQALSRRGLPRKLYVDNGPSFRSATLKYACARLGVALLHSRPYIPEGRGKIERFFLTVRTQFLPLLPEVITLEDLNARFQTWLDAEYHVRKHSGTAQTPTERYLSHISLLRSAPKDLLDYFRHTVKRKVDKDRTVTLLGRLYEAPVGLIGQTVTLLYHEGDLSRIEIFSDERSAGFLSPLNLAANARVRRTTKETLELEANPELKPESTAPSVYRSGSLFDRAGGQV